MAIDKSGTVNRRLMVGGMVALSGASFLATNSAFAQDNLIARAFFLAYPLYEFARARAQSQLPPNQYGVRRRLSVATDRRVTAPNNDTVYGSAMLDLAAGPVVVDMADTLDRYWSVAFMSAFTDVFALHGTRVSKGRGGKICLVGPQWRGRTEPGARIIRSPTNDVWMLTRVVVSGPDDLPTALAVADAVRLAGVAGAAVPTASPMPSFPQNLLGPSTILTVANMMLARSPMTGIAARARQFEWLGLGPQAPSFEALPASIQSRWQAAFPNLMAELRAPDFGGTIGQSGWAASLPQLADFGGDDRLRSIVALGGLGALPQKEAMYFSAQNDFSGAPLGPDGVYHMTIPSDVPVDAFWSLTLYSAEADGRFFFVDNPISRYSISNRSPGIIKANDGSIKVAIQRNPPTDPNVNWLPAANGPMRLSFRTYLPRAVIRTGRWAPPKIERISAAL